MFVNVVRYALWMVGCWMVVMLFLAGGPARQGRQAALPDTPKDALSVPAEPGKARGPSRTSGPSRFGVAHSLPKALPVETLERMPLHQFTETDVEAYLEHLASRAIDPLVRLNIWMKKGIGMPYQAHVLGESPFELDDPDPLYSLGGNDGLSFCEQILALSLSENWSGFIQLLQRLRYRDGLITLANRNIDIATEWNAHNAWLLEDACRVVGGGRQWGEATFFWSPGDYFHKMRLASPRGDIRTPDVFIPRSRIPNVLADLKEGDIIEIVRGSEQRATVAHLGFLMHGTDEAVEWIHCAAPEARQESLLAYVQDNPWVLGLKVLRIRPFADRLVQQELQRTRIGPPPRPRS